MIQARPPASQPKEEEGASNMRSPATITKQGNNDATIQRRDVSTQTESFSVGIPPPIHHHPPLPPFSPIKATRSPGAWSHTTDVDVSEVEKEHRKDIMQNAGESSKEEGEEEEEEEEEEGEEEEGDSTTSIPSHSLHHLPERDSSSSSSSSSSTTSSSEDATALGGEGGSSTKATKSSSSASENNHNKDEEGEEEEDLYEGSSSSTGDVDLEAPIQPSEVLPPTHLLVKGLVGMK